MSRNPSRRVDQWAPGLSIHEMGTARMGRDAKTSMLNGYNQSHDVPNLFVTDGASMPSERLAEPVPDFHGHHRARLRLRGRTTQTWQTLRK
jgi:hypothetical protein